MFDKLKSFFTSSPKTKKRKRKVKPESPPLPSNPLPNKSNRLEELSQQLTDALQEFYKEKGNSFEAYVVGKFDQRYFKLIHWRSDKRTAGVYAESNKYPDLVFEFRAGQNSQYLAIECKWRSEWYNNDGLYWAKDYQIQNYQEYQQKQKIPVFVVIGLGGTPNHPQHVFVAPINRLKYPFAKRSYLAQFRRPHTDRNFFFNVPKTTLS